MSHYQGETLSYRAKHLDLHTLKGMPADTANQHKPPQLIMISQWNQESGNIVPQPGVELLDPWIRAQLTQRQCTVHMSGQFLYDALSRHSSQGGIFPHTERKATLIGQQ
jgi:hypothetical protein